jgi:hypothetical protein
MPTLTVIKHFDVTNITAGFFPRSVIFSVLVKFDRWGFGLNWGWQRDRLGS